MPTSRGWTAAGVAAALLVLWVAFGERELMATALFLAVALGAGLVLTRLSPGEIVLERHLFPTAAHEGDTVTVEVQLVTERRLRNVHVEDTVHGLGVARFAASKTTPGQPVLGRYEISCRERGVFKVGPARITVSDPLGLTEHGTSAGRVHRLMVYPRIETLHALPAVRGIDPAVAATRPTFAPTGGDDFFTLREYQTGDDLRKVHWPSSAKRDDLMIKQLDNPWQPRALVVLDPRADRYPAPEDFERGVRGAASVVAHLYKGGFGPALWTSDTASDLRADDQYRSAMEVLATVQPLPRLDLRAAIARLRRRGVGGGVLVFVTGAPDDDAVGACHTLARDFSATVVMAAARGAEGPMAALERSNAGFVFSPAGTAWAPGWKAAMERSWSIASAG
jgi:uncharacterized protein (DUF58 family)